MGWIRSLGSVVIMVKLSTLPPSSGLRQASHNPAKAKGSLLFEMNPHRDLALSFLAPLIETVSGDDATATIHEKLEGR